MTVKTRRKHREGEVTCHCNAYGTLPHRFGGGKCTGYELVRNYWEANWGNNECSNCHLYNKEENHCQVVEGVEREDECPVFQEFVSFQEIRLLGPYWRTK